MRFKVLRHFGVIFLVLLFGFTLQACSGQQQAQEDMEVSQGEQQEGEQLAQDESGSQDEYAEQGGEGEYAEQGGQGEYAEQGSQGGDAYAESDESDLQDIINEMNAQQGQDGSQANAQALEQDFAQPSQDMPMQVADAQPVDAGVAATPQTTASVLPFQPGGSPAGLGLPEMGSKMPYIVQKGDTLGKIAKRVYGNQNRWRQMSELSGLTNPSRIYPGDVVYYTLDESSLTFAAAYENVQKSEEVAQQGDTLAAIAQRVYGDSTAWKSIWRQNDQIDNPDVIEPGTVVYFIQHNNLTAEIRRVKEQLAQIANQLFKDNKTQQISTVVEDDSFDTFETDSFDSDVDSEEWLTSLGGDLQVEINNAKA